MMPSPSSLPLPSRRLLLLMCAAAALFLFADWAALAVDALLVVAAVTDAVLTPRGRQLDVTRTVPDRLAQGASADVEIEVTNTSEHATHLRITDDLPAGVDREPGRDVERIDVPAGSTRKLRYTVHARRRGTAELGDVHLRVLGPLGLIWTQRRFARRDPMRIQPGVLDVRRYRLLAHRQRLRDLGMRSVRMRGAGTAFESMREYVRGDDPRTIDWKSTARHGQLIVRQHEAERSQNVFIAVDAGRMMADRIGQRERLDYALSATMLLAEVASVQDDRVGTMVFADRIQRFLPPTRNPLGRLADNLTDVQPRLVEPDYPAAFAYLARKLQRRSLLVVFTDVIDPSASSALLDRLAAANRRHRILTVLLRNTDLDAAAARPAESEPDVYLRAAAEELLAARDHAILGMRRAGVLVADARPEDAMPTVVNEYLDIKRRGLI